MFSTKGAKHCVLHGILRIGGQRSFTFSLENEDIFLVCNTFWKEETLFAPFSEKGANFTETFTVSNSNQFLEKVQNNYLNIELSKIKSNPEVIGFLRLPLHQFFIAYRDASLTNRLSDGQFPVISTKKWVPVLNSSSGEQIGEIECLMAMGTEKQIENMENASIHKNRTAKIESTTLENVTNYIPTEKSFENELFLPVNSKICQTSDLLNKLQKSLVSTASNISHAQPGIQLAESNSFRIVLEIKSARNLPPTQCLRLKKKLNRSLSAKGNQNIGCQTGEEPSTFVTFQANKGEGPMVKSHEGMVYSTAVIEKNSNPVWNESFCISGSVDCLINKNERFILKVWKKAAKSNVHGKNVPCPMEDAIIGFASIGFCDLIENVPILNGWFDIVDFSGHINGQIHIVAKPFDDIKKVKELVRNNQVENLLESFESSLDINNINLCRAVKRKFTELEEISERLRVRLLDVTGSADVYKVAREISDEQLEEFEHDLNTSACEDENESFSSQTPHLNASPRSSHTQ